MGLLHLIGYSLLLRESRAEAQERSLEAEAEAETMLLTTFFHGLLVSLLSYTTQSHLPGGDTSELALLRQSDQDSTPQMCPQALTYDCFSPQALRVACPFSLFRWCSAAALDMEVKTKFLSTADHSWSRSYQFAITLSATLGLQAPWACPVGRWPASAPGLSDYLCFFLPGSSSWGSRLLAPLHSATLTPRLLSSYCRILKTNSEE